MKTDREKTIELFLGVQGYERDRITNAMSALTGESSETTDTDSPLLTPKELCEMLKISVTTLWRMKVPHLVVGARKRYVLKTVKDFLAKRRGEKESTTPALTD